MPRLCTFMSRVRYRLPAEGASKPIEKMADVVSNGAPISWLDHLLEGGLVIPENTWNQQAPAFVLLLAGPPGTGKTTFATELCYNLAHHCQPADQDGWKSLYVSAESTADRVIENALSFGWNKERFAVFDGAQLKPGVCTVYGADRLMAQAGDKPDYEGFFEALVKTWLRRVGDDVWAPIVGHVEGPGIAAHEALPPDVVVIDSLNVLQSEHGGASDAVARTFHKLMKWIGKGEKSPRLLVIVLDNRFADGRASLWEYLVDAVFRFDTTESSVGPDGYYLRTFEIVKIRTQRHAWGKHVFKIYPGPEKPNRFARPNVPPYLETGGAYVFPSVHWHLSKSERFPPSSFAREEAYSTGLPSLDSIIGDSHRVAGFSPMQTSALVGRRGALKSHLAYHFLLRHALGAVENDPRPKNVLLISLRDDLDSAKQTLATIVEQQAIVGSGMTGRQIVQSLIDADRLEISYNSPGCIGPGEFFHRVFVALAREREATNFCLPGGAELPRPERETAEIVVLNGLDHLEAKFPLCEAEKVFIPALISLFRNYKVCSVVIAAEEMAGMRSANIGAMSDLVLEFAEVGKGDRMAAPATDVHKWCSLPDGICQAVEIAATRVPAGQVGGRWGLLGRNAAGFMSFHPAHVK